MEDYARTDLACEAVDGASDPGAAQGWRERRVGPFSVRTLTLTREEAAQYGIREGSYINVDFERATLLYGGGEELLLRLLAGEIRGMSERLSGKRIDPAFGVFVAGLGNADLTADSVGPVAVSHLHATRHLRQYEGELYERIECSSLSALAPGVLGQTGIETLEILRGAVSAVAPDVVIIIDALAARSCERLASTIQISDTGIVPGSGVGNHRNELSEQSLGVPVISIGIPTVVNSATLVYDVLQRAGFDTNEPSVARVLKSGKSFFVSPKECDQIVKRAGFLISEAITLAFAQGLRA